MKIIRPILNTGIFFQDKEVKSCQSFSEVGLFSHMLYDENKIISAGTEGYLLRTKVD